MSRLFQEVADLMLTGDLHTAHVAKTGAIQTLLCPRKKRTLTIYPEAGKEKNRQIQVPSSLKRATFELINEKNCRKEDQSNPNDKSNDQFGNKNPSTIRTAEDLQVW